MRRHGATRMFERGALARLGRRAVERARAPTRRPETARARKRGVEERDDDEIIDDVEIVKAARLVRGRGARRGRADVDRGAWTRIPEASARAPNRASREVRSGHYVAVEPEALANPRARLASTTCAEAIGFRIARECENLEEGFVKYFSGDVGGARETTMRTWATPYALSIMGTADDEQLSVRERERVRRRTRDFGGRDGESGDWTEV